MKIFQKIKRAIGFIFFDRHSDARGYVIVPLLFVGLTAGGIGIAYLSNLSQEDFANRDCETLCIAASAEFDGERRNDLCSCGDFWISPSDGKVFRE